MSWPGWTSHKQLGPGTVCGRTGAKAVAVWMWEDVNCKACLKKKPVKGPVKRAR
jgi:hypothetical protein